MNISVDSKEAKTYRLLTEVLPKELSGVIFEYTFSIYFDKKVCSLKHIMSYDVDVMTTIKNKKLYSFCHETCTLTIEHIHENMLPFKFCRNTNMFIYVCNDGTEYIYVRPLETIYVFNDKCEKIHTVDTTHISLSDGIFVLPDKICVYNNFYKKVYFINSDGKILYESNFGRIIHAQIFNKEAYILKNYKEICKLSCSNENKTYPENKTTEYMTIIEKFHLTENELYIWAADSTNFKCKHYVHVYDHNKNFLRLVLSKTIYYGKNISAAIMFDDNNTYLLTRNSLTKKSTLDIYTRQKIKLY